MKHAPGTSSPSRVVLSETNGLVFEFTCKIGTNRAHFIEEGAQLRILDVLCGITKSILSIAIHFNQSFQNFDHMIMINAFSSRLGHRHTPSDGSQFRMTEQ